MKNSAAKAFLRRQQKKREDKIMDKLAQMDEKLSIVEEQGQLVHVELKRSNDQDELLAREEIRHIRIKRSVDHAKGMDEYLTRVHEALDKISPNQQNLPNYIEMVRSVAELGEKLTLSTSSDKEEKKNPVQINLAVLTGAMPSSQQSSGETNIRQLNAV